MTLNQEALQNYADLLIRVGLNLQPGQALRVSGELAHSELVRRVAGAAYRAGARYVHVDWVDDPVARSRLQHSAPEHLEYYPDYEVARHRQMVDEGWARLSLVGPEFPNIFDDVDPGRLRRVSAARRQRIKFYMQAVMSNRFQWCVAAAPTSAWAQQVFPDVALADALDRLWRVILQTCRVDRPDPAQAWQEHDDQLKRISAFMARRDVRTIRYLDPAPGPDGEPATDLTVGLTDHPNWVGGSSTTQAGVRFMANMPTEEVFSTPHRARVSGWVRTSKAAFPFGRRVDDAYFRFEEGQVVEYRAGVGQDVLEQFFQIPGTERLGEVSLVDVRSPINRSGLLFHETLFDENAVCHIAFGDGYAEGVRGGDDLPEEELRAAGINQSDEHEDFMIGTPSMNVLGTCADGSQVTIMQDGQFTQEVLDAQPEEDAA
jgi:aminopeptidase